MLLNAQLNSNNEMHWSQTLNQYLTHRLSDQGFADEVTFVNKDTSNEWTHELMMRLGLALEVGNTIVDLSEDEPWLSELNQTIHPLVGYAKQQSGSRTPIVIEHTKTGYIAYLHRQWFQENSLANSILRLLEYCQSSQVLRNEESVDVSHLPKSMHPQQKLAVTRVLEHNFCIITGGPGTGKTWTVAQLVITLLRHNPAIKIALAAPTGKAAQRMQESLENGIQSSLNEDEKATFTALVQSQLDSAKTLHRLLCLGFNTRPKFNAQKPLPYDLIIVDEASMLGVELANLLMNAVGKYSKIILLGDANQLAAVDAGAVLSDLCNSPILANNHVNLTESKRFSADSGVGVLAMNVLENKPKQAIDCLHNHPDLNLMNPFAQNSFDFVYKHLWQGFERYANALSEFYKQPIDWVESNINQLFAVFDEYRVLTSTHGGKFGDDVINKQLTQLLLAHSNHIHTHLTKDAWFHGRPTMLLKNDYQLKLSNGDIGIALMNEQSQYQVYFPQHKKPIAVQKFSTNTIATAFAMTIHKSQGSEYKKVTIVLDKIKNTNQTQDSMATNLLSRELIYTGITRARKHIDVLADDDTLIHSIQTQTTRKTGLTSLLK